MLLFATYGSAITKVCTGKVRPTCILGQRGPARCCVSVTGVGGFESGAIRASRVVKICSLFRSPRCLCLHLCGKSTVFVREFSGGANRLGSRHVPSSCLRYDTTVPNNGMVNVSGSVSKKVPF